MSFVDLKLLKMYNKKDPKELLSLKTRDIKGKPIKYSRNSRKIENSIWAQINEF